MLHKVSVNWPDQIVHRFIVTCGNDGDVRIWESLDDDDPKFITVGEKAYSLALKVGFSLTFLQMSSLFGDTLHHTSDVWTNVFSAPQNGKLVTASSNNTVQIHTFPDGDPDGILTRFTTNATHVAFNSIGSRVAAGSRYLIVG